MDTLLPLTDLLTAVSTAAPCGVLEPSHVAQITALSKAIKGKPPHITMRQGAKVVLQAGQEPDWHLLRHTAEAIFLGGETANLSDERGPSAKISLSKIKHLHAAMVLLLGALQTSGLPAFAEGLVLIERLLKDYWDSLHPLPDLEAAEPFYARAGVLAPLETPFRDTSDSWKFVERLYAAPLIESKSYGLLTVRDCLAARSGGAALNLPSGREVSREIVTAARLDFVIGIVERQEAVKEAIRAAQSIEKILSQNSQGKTSVNLTPIIDVLRNTAAALADAPAGDNSGLATDEETKGKDEQETADEGTGNKESVGPWLGGTEAPNPRKLATREQAVRKLAEVAKYFREQEPASPIPLLLERAQRLAGMNFLRILEELELGEQAVPAFKKLAGVRDPEAGSGGTAGTNGGSASSS